MEIITMRTDATSSETAIGKREPRKGLSRARTITYWTFTTIVAYEMVAGSMWDLLRIEYVRAMLAHLGYPMYLLTILGVWKLPCGVVLMLPGFLRLKEWAYAGAFFNYTGAAASHFMVGDHASKWAGPLILAAMTLGSWALRPPARRLVGGRSDEITLRQWLVPAVVLVVMFVL